MVSAKLSKLLTAIYSSHSTSFEGIMMHSTVKRQVCETAKLLSSEHVARPMPIA